MNSWLVLLWLFAVNGAPIVAGKLLGQRWDHPVDGGAKAWDGRPWFGPSKTWRGLVAALLVGELVGLYLGFRFGIGFGVGGLAMLGDLLSSFSKRRLGFSSSSMALGLDQVPESLIPLLWLQAWISLDRLEVLALVLAFWAGEILLSRFLFKLHIRDQPY